MTTTPALSIAEQADIVRMQRQSVREQGQRISEVRAAFAATIADEVTAYDDARARLDADEQALRCAALEAYLLSGNKHPHPAVGIRVTTRLDYDERTALAWATRHGLALKLDTKAFEAIVKATPLEFVAVSEVPTATIATDLEKALAGREDDTA